jgi:3-dehydroquinate dehydratase / shikimate dehydrogenase
MGEKGVVTRILASKYGGFLTFGALSSGQESAPGQPTLQDLINMYRIREQSAETKVFGIIGNPVKHSRSPVLHNKAMASAGFVGVYVPLLVDDMDSFMSTFSDVDWAGYSVTIPHKVSFRSIALIRIVCPRNMHVVLTL